MDDLKAISVVAGHVQRGEFDDAIRVTLREHGRILSDVPFVTLAAVLDRIPREHWRRHAGATQRLAVLGNFSTQFLVRALFYAFAFRGILCEFHEAPFDQWERELIDPESTLGRSSQDAVILCISSLALTAYGTRWPTDTAVRVQAAISAYRRRAGAVPMFVFLPEPLEEEADPFSAAVDWRTRITAELESVASDLGVDTIPSSPLLRSMGSDAWRPGRYWITAKVAHHPGRAFEFARYLAMWVAPRLRSQIRLVITDLDGTLWGGLVGESGWDGVDLDREQSGAGYLRLQRYLADLRTRGVLLAICSKNDFADVRAAFERRDEMILRLEDFAAVAVDWRPKSENVQRVCTELNLTTDGVAFLDDSPAERAEIRALLPDVLVPELPDDSGDRVAYLASLPEMAVRPTTAEDARRVGYYAEERRRQEASAEFTTLEDYYRSLGIRIRPERIGAATLDRVTQLVQKTNQFNLTTRRRGRVELAALAADEGNFAYAYHVEDRFGSYGLTGVVLCVPTENDSYTIDTWVLSCRVMGRTVETAIFDHLLAWIRRRGGRTLIGEYIATPKNGAVRGLYADLGLKLVGNPQTDGGERYLVELDAFSFTLNRYVEIQESVLT